MWQNYGAKNPKKKVRKKNYNKTPVKYHMKRIPAQLSQKEVGLGQKPHPKDLVAARILLNDLKPEGLTMFTEKPLMVGDSIRITLLEPTHFYCKGRVVWCQELPSEGRILSPFSFTYRVGIQFEFDSELDSQRIKKYCEKILEEELRISEEAA